MQLFLLYGINIVVNLQSQHLVFLYFQGLDTSLYVEKEKEFKVLDFQM